MTLVNVFWEYYTIYLGYNTKPRTSCDYHIWLVLSLKFSFILDPDVTYPSLQHFDSGIRLAINFM